MKIISYVEMLNMPEGTVYYTCERRYHGALDGPFVKDYHSDTDIFYCTAAPRINYEGSHPQSTNPVERGMHISLDSDGTREGNFDHEAQYLVLMPDEVEILIEILRGKASRAESIPVPHVKAWEDM